MQREGGGPPAGNSWPYRDILDDVTLQSDSSRSSTRRPHAVVSGSSNCSPARRMPSFTMPSSSAAAATSPSYHHSTAPTQQHQQQMQVQVHPPPPRLLSDSAATTANPEPSNYWPSNSALDDTNAAEAPPKRRRYLTARPVNPIPASEEPGRENSFPVRRAGGGRGYRGSSSRNDNRGGGRGSSSSSSSGATYTQWRQQGHAPDYVPVPVDTHRSPRHSSSDERGSHPHRDTETETLRPRRDRDTTYHPTFQPPSRPREFTHHNYSTQPSLESSSAPILPSPQPSTSTSAPTTATTSSSPSAFTTTECCGYLTLENLSPDVEKDHIRSVCEKFGPCYVEKLELNLASSEGGVTVATAAATSKATVRFELRRDAVAARNALHQAELDGDGYVLHTYLGR